MRVVIVTHSSPYEPRARAIQNWCEKQGYDTLCIFSAFDHHAHKTRQLEEDGIVWLPMAPYKRNLSVRRMKSIYDFSKTVEEYLETQEFDILYTMVPANSLAAASARIKEKKQCKVIMDVLDLWPESLPLEKVDWLPPLQLWRKMRDDNLSAADTIVTECAYFQEWLNIPSGKAKTLYWIDESIALNAKKRAQKGMTLFADPKEKDVLHIGYIGAINNIIDIESIVGVLTEVRKHCSVRVHVIGDGEGRTHFLKAMRDHQIGYQYYGKVYDPDRKEQILCNCDFGINMMKKSVKVGLTMKSMEYLAHGLPLINNIQGDTWQLIEKADAGVNVGYNKKDFAQAASKVIEKWKDIAAAKNNALTLYNDTFTIESFEGTLSEILK